MQVEATSEAALVRQLAVHTFPHGYFYYVTGTIGVKKDPSNTDEHFIRKYKLADSWGEKQRFLRKRDGLANLRYYRFERTWILCWTDGDHWIWNSKKEGGEDGYFSDIRNKEEPLVFRGRYEMVLVYGTNGKPHTRVGIPKRQLDALDAYFTSIATRRSQSQLEYQIRNLVYEPYRQVWSELRSILWRVNRKRKAAGLPMIPLNTVRTRKTKARVFDPDGIDHYSEDVPDEELTEFLGSRAA